MEDHSHGRDLSVAGRRRQLGVGSASDFVLFEIFGFSCLESSKAVDLQEAQVCDAPYPLLHGHA